MLRVSRPLLLEALNSTSAAAAASTSTSTSTIRPTQAGSPTSTSSAGTSARQGGRRQQYAQRKPLSERYDIGGHPHPPLNPRYSSLVVGEHFGRIVHDRRAEMMAILSATNLIREVIAGDGHVLLTSTDKRLEAELLAAARDTGEFSHAGKWLPGGFTNRPQVATVPKLPSLVIAFEPDNHILMREAFQMCIPRVAPVNIYKTRADFTPEVPLHATEYTLNEKRRMIAFFASFIAKIKYGQMPVGDTQSRYKEYVDRMRTSYHNQVRDMPDPYRRAARRPFDSRPDLKYGVHPAHVDYNAQRAFEESLNYHPATLQPASYLDDAATEDDIIARDLPPIESYDVGHTVEYSTLTDKYTASIPSDHGTWVKDSEGRNIPELNNRDYEHEELMADLQARREAGIKAEPHWSSTEAAKMQRRGDELEMLSSTMPDAELRDQYEAWLKDRQDQANDFIPFDRKTEYDAPSKFSQPSEKQAQDRLWKLKTRVRENQTRKQETEGKKNVAARERRMANKGMPTLTRGMTRVPFLDESFLEDASTGKRQFSTFARPTAFMTRSYSTASAAQAESAAPFTSATSSSSSTPASTSRPQRRFVIPRFTLPLFLIVPLFAYFASLYHTDEETLAKVEAEQKEMIEGLKAKLGLQTLQAESSSETAKVEQSKEQVRSS